MEGVATIDATGWCGAFIVFFGAATSFAIGLYYRLGNSKEYFLGSGVRRFFGADNYPFLMPLGVAFFLMGVSFLAPNPAAFQALMLYVVLPAFALAIIIGLWRPKWIRPRWLNQLKENHPDVYPYLKWAAAQEVGDDPVKARAWSERLDTVEGQNEWVAEVRKRYGWPEPGGAEGTEEG